MGLDLWFKDDVVRILASVHQAMASTSRAVVARQPERDQAYQQGFIDALRTVGVAFGVSPLTIANSIDDRRTVHSAPDWLDGPVLVHDTKLVGEVDAPNRS
jgi:hypothetical protein